MNIPVLIIFNISLGDLKRRHSRGSEADFQQVETGSGIISGAQSIQADEDRISYKVFLIHFVIYYRY